MKQKENDLVSILVPCYNHEKYIEDCLKSLIQQEYKNIELVLCDDFSIDSSWNIIKKYEKKLNERFVRTVLIRNSSNLGLTKTLNKMLDKANGKYIKIIASDDMLLPTCINDSVNIFEKNPEIGVIVSNGWCVEEEYRFGENGKYSIFYEVDPILDEKSLFNNLYWINNILAAGVCLKHEVYDKYGNYDENINIEDWEYWLRLSRANVIFFYNKKAEVIYRKNANSMTSAVKNSQLETRRKRIHEAEMKIIEKYGVFFDKSIYAKRKYYAIVGELDFAQNNALKEMGRLVERELEKFYRNERKFLGLKDRIYLEWNWIKGNYKS